MASQKVALISDTHIPTILAELPSHLIDQLRGVHRILHAGDLVSLDTLQPLQAIASTLAVHGNSDELEVLHHLPYKQMVTIAGHRIGLIHGNRSADVERKYLQPDFNYDSPVMEAFYEFLLAELPVAGIIVFGHFHVPEIRYYKHCLLINPGSIAPYRGQRSYGLLELEPGQVKAEIIQF